MFGFSTLVIVFLIKELVKIQELNKAIRIYKVLSYTNFVLL